LVNYHRIVGGPLNTNTYLVYAGDSGVVVDPGVHPRLDASPFRVGRCVGGL